MRKFFTLSLFIIFAIAFGIGILASPAMARPEPPEGCYWQCDVNHWDLCCETAFGIRCFHTLEEC